MPEKWNHNVASNAVPLIQWLVANLCCDKKLTSLSGSNHRTSTIGPQAAAAQAEQAFTLRRRLLQRAAQRPAIIERGANANAHVQALSTGSLHGCLRVCTGCGCNNKQSRRRLKAIASCVCGNCGSRTSHHRRIDSSGAAIFNDLLQGPL